MAISDSEKSELLDALERMLASGLTEVKYQDRTLKYRSVEELERAIARLKKQLNKGSRKRYYMSTSKGLK